jgi:uncharacterized protein with FMN-binding domain
MKILLIVLSVVVLIAIPLSILMFYGMSELRQLVINQIDLQNVEDGTHTGSYHKGRWTYDIEVVVRDHRIVSVKNTNARMNALNDWNAKAEMAMLEKQSNKIDVVSGASLNSKAFQKAVELALSHPAER